MRRLVVLALTGEERRRLAADLGNTTQVRDCARAGELLALASQPGVSAVVAGLRDATGAPAVEALLALQRERPLLPLVVVLSLTASDARALLDLVDAGLQATWVIRGIESVGGAVNAALARNDATGAATAILRTAGPVVGHPSAYAVLIFGAIGAARPVTVDEAARLIRISPRTLERQFQHAGLPPPREVLTYCRGLHTM